MSQVSESTFEVGSCYLRYSLPPGKHRIMFQRFESEPSDPPRRQNPADKSDLLSVSLFSSFAFLFGPALPR